MQELIYDVNSLLIALALFFSMLLAIEIGYRLGRRIMPTMQDDFKAHVNANSASLLGIPALLPGFTFSLSLQRYDSRREALVDEANASVSSPVATGLFIPALHDPIDNFGKRDAEMNRHVPEFVRLLYITFLMTGTIVGYATGPAGHRASFVTHIMVGLIVVLVFIIVDLDRPHRGSIRVNQDSLTGLQAFMREPVANAGGN